MSTSRPRGKTTPASTPGSFTTHAHGAPDIEIADAAHPSSTPAPESAGPDAARGRALLRGITDQTAMTLALWSMRDNGQKRRIKDLGDMVAGADSEHHLTIATRLVDGLENTMPKAVHRRLTEQAQQRRTALAARAETVSAAPGSATEQAIARAAARGISPGALVMTDSGQARVVEVGYRGVHVEVLDPGTWTSDSGKVVPNDPHRHIMAGTPGYDRIKPVHPAPVETADTGVVAAAVAKDVEEYGETSNVFRPIGEVHADYKSRNADGTWSVMTASKSSGTVLAPHRGPTALDEWYASQAVFGPGRPDAARKAIATYFDAKAKHEDRPWDDDNRRALARAKRLRDAYAEYDDTFTGH